VLDPEKLLPFYSLQMEKTLVPVFDLEERVVIGEAELNAKFPYVKALDSQVKTFTVVFAVLGGLLLVAAVAAHVIYMQRKRRAGP